MSVKSQSSAAELSSGTDPSSPDYDYRELEEAALHGLLKLSSQCAGPVIDQVESEYRTARQIIETSFQQIKEEHDTNYQSEINQLQQHFQKQTDAIKKEYETQKHTLLTRTKNEKEKSVDNIEIEHAQFKANYDYEIMVAEIVEKGSLKKLQQKAVEVKEFVSAAKAQFDQLRERAEQDTFFLPCFRGRPAGQKSCCRYRQRASPDGVF